MPALSFRKDLSPRLEQPGSDTRRSRALQDMVMTPDRIPQFVIPSLGVPGPKTLRKLSSSSAGYDLHGPDRSRSPSPRRNSLASVPLPQTDLGDLEHRTGEDFHKHAADHRVLDLSDPVTQAAMSLPHLAKITTPYGFLTLSESPCIWSKESLFFDQEIRRQALFLGKRSSSGAHTLHPCLLSGSTAAPDAGSLFPRSRSSPLAELCNLTEPGTAASNKTGRSLSCDATALGARKSCLSAVAENRTRVTAASSGAKNTSKPVGKGKLQQLINKHLSGIRRLKYGSSFLKKAQEGRRVPKIL
ncbi:C2 calcium-dependent domain-containing protein 4B-like [Acipenser ruthenus]|uniref:C2 calcium-dependent domain-containing protein 4B-like n=1 Tax=Acipenser ruthenus TaxID=7906 RepID=UPI002741C048|nr:C2 calcium-dependent domain-containing protein 4B-like [Acipenser ruthenus]